MQDRHCTQTKVKQKKLLEEEIEEGMEGEHGIE